MYCKTVIDAKVKKGIDVPTSDDLVLTQSKEIFNNTEWLALVDALCAMMTKKHVGEDRGGEVHEEVIPQKEITSMVVE